MYESTFPPWPSAALLGIFYIPYRGAGCVSLFQTVYREGSYHDGEIMLRNESSDPPRNYGFTFQLMVATLKAGFEKAIVMLHTRNFELLICVSYYQIREQSLFSRESAGFGKVSNLSSYKIF